MLLSKNPMKWLFYGAVESFYFIKRFGGERRQVLVYGSLPARPYLQYKIFKLLGLEAVSSSDSPALVYAHVDSTFRPALPGINGRCTDITKSKVALSFEQVFGYALSVDPTTYSREMVRKGEANATHDGVVILGPCQPVEGYVYQRLVDATDEHGEWTDLRTCIVGSRIPFVLVKKRSIAKQFANDGNKVSMVDAKEVFNPDEVVKLVELAQALGLDIGEMDVMRDRLDGRLYVVDVANTPHSPGDSYIKLNGFRSVQLAAESFRRQYLEP